MSNTDTPTSTVADLQVALDAEQTRDEYNGWTNRETWATYLHLSNDYDLYTIARRLVTEADAETVLWYEAHDTTPPPIADTNAAADRLEDWVDEMVDHYHDQTAEYTRSPTVGMMIKDVGSFWRVDWYAVAAAFRDD